MKPYLILLAILLSASAALIFLPINEEPIVREGGIVEVMSAVLYGLLIVLLLVLRKLRWFWGNFLCAFCLLILLFRELDFDKAFTTMGIFKSNFYKSDTISILEKMSGLSVTLLIIAGFFITLKAYRVSLLKGIKQLKNIELGIAMAVLLAMVSKLVLDGLPRKMENIGLSLAGFMDEHHGTIEEVLELGIPLSLLMSFYFLCRQSSQSLKAVG